MRHHLIVGALLASASVGALASAGPVAAQSPSTEQIIRSLRPVAPSATDRGIRQIGSAPGAHAPGAHTPAGTPSSSAAGSAAGPASASHGSAGIARPAAPSAAPSVNLTVNFGTGSDELTPQAIRALDDLGRALTSPRLAGFRFRIEGHTDTVGTPETNKALSERRAVAVVDYLSSKWGVDKAKVESVGMGQEQLLVPTGANVPQPRNRRVTVINIGA